MKITLNERTTRRSVEHLFRLPGNFTVAIHGVPINRTYRYISNPPRNVPVKPRARKLLTTSTVPRTTSATPA
ncbi:hypothetical protein EYF80_046742 [Liparis tanakae]|uniref:Uncharacterized protein n=1 Tax=Liparis tanakae TaxID=230148 RepID=A0A4Z2FQI4_9TELE|nr:hypothetical protein EYF80_046742 [Liparis tanakae]